MSPDPVRDASVAKQLFLGEILEERLFPYPQIRARDRDQPVPSPLPRPVAAKPTVR